MLDGAHEPCRIATAASNQIGIPDPRGDNTSFTTPNDKQSIEMQPSPDEVASYGGVMSTTSGSPSQAQIEAAVEQTLVGWGAELDAGQKFWWMDWNRMIRDAITAMRTGEPVLYDDDE